MLNTVKDTREMVVETAFEACRRRGPEGVSMRQIGQTLGISAPALYYHFENRQDLLDAVANHGFEQFEKQLANIKARTPRGRILAILDEYRAFAAAHQKLFGLMFVEPRPGARRYPDDFAAGHSSVFNALQSAVEDYKASNKHVKDSSLEVAHDLWALTHGHIMLWLAGRFVNHRAFQTKLTGSLKRALASL
jgi:AcrR family transcriptional regulator